MVEASVTLGLGTKFKGTPKDSVMKIKTFQCDIKKKNINARTSMIKYSNF